jgi:hypothetical protein
MTKRRALLATLLLIALPGARAEAQAQAARAPAELERAFAAYDSTFRRQDPTGIAAWFLPNGEMGSVGHPPVVGPDSIAATLRRFADFRLLASRLVPDSVQVHADSAWIGGHYWQRVRLPAGDTVEAHGTFTMTWVRRSGAEWRIRRLTTDP